MNSIRTIVKHHGHVAAQRVIDHMTEQHQDLGVDLDPYLRLAHEAMKTTHVVVGDHTPEPREPAPRAASLAHARKVAQHSAMFSSYGSALQENVSKPEEPSS